MKALCWYGKYDVRVVDVPQPKILNSRDAIIKVTTTQVHVQRDRARAHLPDEPHRHDGAPAGPAGDLHVVPSTVCRVGTVGFTTSSSLVTSG